MTVETIEGPGAAGAAVRPTGRQVLVLVPAHNEEDVIGRALSALHAQELDGHPDTAVRLVVVADNCTDGTVPLAQGAGAETFTTHGNRAKKGGALNQALGALLPGLADHDAVLVTDADCALDPGFLGSALDHLDRGYSGIGGIFRGDPGGGFVGHLQRNEYARYARDVERLGGRCLVLTGTAALFRAGTLREISAARLDGRLPAGDGAGGVYDTTVLTEDNELTFAVLHLGGRIVSPPSCTLSTEVMPSWRALWRQRLRWKRGAVENCAQYGLTRITWRYWGPTAADHARRRRLRAVPGHPRLGPVGGRRRARQGLLAGRHRRVRRRAGGDAAQARVALHAAGGPDVRAGRRLLPAGLPRQGLPRRAAAAAQVLVTNRARPT
ncbi:glycosyltransferase [Streptacidiphilus jiangxiensis]|uniref:glycosyltransferase n=1 Tax=Streptacidiphilus jiangxiensis TaxID=235985 RepID=UPI000A65B04F|nr:glycosyltransferase family 2 protein [Streptacidiphilus jiangxiensis]